MAEDKADFIKVPAHATNGVMGRKATMPVEPHKRLKDEELYIEICTVVDADTVAEDMHLAFPDAWWEKMEPVELRDSDLPTRKKRLTTRLSPTFDIPTMKWIKAIYAPTGQTIGIAGWMLPGMPVHNVWRKSAQEFYKFPQKMGWTDADIAEMWKGVDREAWEGHIGENDRIREAVMGDEPHWFLAPLMTWPEFQGRGVATKLMEWANKQADQKEPPEAMYLESAPTARAVYMRFGFVPQGENNFLRREPAVVRGLEVEEWGGGEAERKGEKVDVEVVEKEMDAELAS